MQVPPTLTHEEIERLVSGRCTDPFALLGAHGVHGTDGEAVAIRVFLPGARRVTVLEVPPGGRFEAGMIHEGGLFEAVLHGWTGPKPYRLEVDFGSERPSTFHDCYSFLPVLTEEDLYLFNQGTHYRIYEKLGAHPCMHQGVAGVCFAVWAPSAARVSVIGDFNQWNGLRHQMRLRGASGVWELFIPHLGPGLLYKFEILTRDGVLLLKADPYASGFETRPKTAAVVHDLRGFPWTDREWMEARERANPLDGPVAVYEVHLGSWRRGEESPPRWLTYREAAGELVDYVREMGFTHLEFLPLAEHPFDGSWGYQVTGHYAPTSRFGSPRDFMRLVDRCHEAGLGVILDWVPAHFPRDAHGLEYFDGTHLYEHADPRQGVHRDWDTLIFNYGRNEVRNFLVANALFWLDYYHIDGLRVDAVASMLYLDYSRKEGEWVPNRYGGRENLEAVEFLTTLTTKVHEYHPGVITVAEESTSWPGVTRPVHMGGLGFMFKWNMGWMHDMLSFMSEDPIHRRFRMDKLTFPLLYAFNENFMLPLSHDEVVHGKASLLGKMPGDAWRKCANLRLLLGYMYGEPGKKVLFMGAELGAWSEWDHDGALPWHLLAYEPHRGIRRFVKDLNRLYRCERAFHALDSDPRGFEWIDFSDSDATVVSFMRKGPEPADTLLFVFNFTPVPRTGYRIGAPRRGFYRELLNSDAAGYGGSNVGMMGGVTADAIPRHGKPFSLCLTLPPLGMQVFKPECL